ncbi:MAG: sporulation protein YabP [Ruminococcaceae bacterium]|nr:sporulation protein YabP [Oscillospiraceae bacterium]
MSESENLYTQSNLFIENREKLRLTGVKDVDNFAEDAISVQSQQGDLVIHGQDLKITKLDVESGELFVEGLISSFFYRENTTEKTSSFFGRLMK